MKLRDKINQLPSSAGIYQYFDKDGNLLYVGKAKDLKRRVRSYFSFGEQLSPNPKLSARITKMINQTFSMNYIVVNTEHDALILENSLIKQLNPKYNILLRDDKTYPYIYIDYTQTYPRFEITRKIIDAKKVTYYGPYSVGARDILDSIYKICKIVQKKGSLKSKKICLYHQIGKCLAPCELDVKKEVYQKEVDLATKLIENKKLLISKLQEKMEFYAEELRFEEALELRDRIDRINRSEIKSDIDFASNDNYDIFVIDNSVKRAVVVKIFMRKGKIISSTHEFVQIDELYDEDELYSRVLVDFYLTHKPPVIAPILVAKNFDGLSVVCDSLSEIFQKKASLKVPMRGAKKDLVDLALLNAKELLKNEKKDDLSKHLEALKELLNLKRVPQRVEIFDNSHMGGVATVGAMVVWQDGGFDKKSYRTYHLDAKDEYAQMRETLTRRVESFSKNQPPDLWVIDGGTTLLKLAKEILDSYGSSLDVVAISKEKVDAKSHRAKGKANDIMHTLDESFKLKNSDKRLQWMQNLRDEAHRSAITFHKKTKLKLDKESNLLTLHGIGMAKIKKLLNHFGTFEELKKVSFEDISTVLNEKDAKVIKTLYK